jgi:hypothetical protein
MLSHLRRLYLLALFSCLVACGQVADLVQYADTADEAQDRNARVANLANTSFVSMPVAGSVIYGGHASVVYVQNGTEVALLGQAVVTANFTNQMISGQVDQVFGGTGLTDLQNYDGVLTFDGQIGVRRPNSFDAVIAGTISGGGQVIAVDGPLIGDFRGMGAQAVSAITNAQMLATVNGIEVPLRVKVTAEQ